MEELKDELARERLKRREYEKQLKLLEPLRCDVHDYDDKACILHCCICSEVFFFEVFDKLNKFYPMVAGHLVNLQNGGYERGHVKRWEDFSTKLFDVLERIRQHKQSGCTLAKGG